MKIGELGVELCPARHAVIVDGTAHRLPDLSFDLLQLLVSQAPGPVSFADIERAVWNAHVTRETIKQRVTLLRESLEQIGIDGRTIEAVRNLGYRTTLTRRDPHPTPDRAAHHKYAVTAGMVLIAAAALFLIGHLWNADDPHQPVIAVIATPSMPGGSTAEIDALRRDMVRTVSKFAGVQVIDRLDRSDVPPAYLVRLSLERSGERRHLATELVDGPSGAVLIAERYAIESGQSDRAMLHFATYLHARVSAVAESGSAMSEEARARYVEAERLWRLGDRQSLLGARKSLEVLAGERGANVIARSLLARVQSDLVLRHGEPEALAQAAERDIRALIARRPGAGDLRYALARTLLAQGEREEALDELHVAARTMPFLTREIMAIEAQSSRSPGGSSNPGNTRPI